MSGELDVAALKAMYEQAIGKASMEGKEGRDAFEAFKEAAVRTGRDDIVASIEEFEKMEEELGHEALGKILAEKMEDKLSNYKAIATYLKDEASSLLAIVAVQGSVKGPVSTDMLRISVKAAILASQLGHASALMETSTESARLVMKDLK